MKTRIRVRLSPEVRDRLIREGKLQATPADSPKRGTPPPARARLPERLRMVPAWLTGTGQPEVGLDLEHIAKTTLRQFPN